MKTRLVVLSGALLLAVAGSAIAQESQQQMQQQTQQDNQPQVRPAGQAGVVHDANMSAQATSDTSYGGTPDTRGATGMTPRPRQCTGSSAQCDIFFGH